MLYFNSNLGATLATPDSSAHPAISSTSSSPSSTRRKARRCWIPRGGTIEPELHSHPSKPSKPSSPRLKPNKPSLPPIARCSSASRRKSDPPSPVCGEKINPQAPNHNSWARSSNLDSRFRYLIHAGRIEPRCPPLHPHRAGIARPFSMKIDTGQRMILVRVILAKTTPTSSDRDSKKMKQRR